MILGSKYLLGRYLDVQGFVARLAWLLQFLFRFLRPKVSPKRHRFGLDFVLMTVSTAKKTATSYRWVQRIIRKIHRNCINHPGGKSLMANEGLLRDSRLPKINVSRSRWFRARTLGPRGVDPIHTQLMKEIRLTSFLIFGLSHYLQGL